MKSNFTTLFLSFFFLFFAPEMMGQLDCGNTAISNVINCTANNTPVHICGSTVGQTNNNTSYNDGIITYTNDGPEDVYFINVNNFFQNSYQNITIDVTLFNFDEPDNDLDLFLLDGCDPNNVIAYHWISASTAFINVELGAFSNFTPNLVLVVEGYDGASSDYELNIEVYPTNFPNENAIVGLTDILDEVSSSPSYCEDDFPISDFHPNFPPIGGTGTESYWCPSSGLHYDLSALARIYKIEHSSVGDITVTIPSSDFPVHTFLYRKDFNISGGCPNQTFDCHLCQTHGTNNQTLTYPNAPAGTYYVIVDAEVGNSGDFVVDVDFNDDNCVSTCNDCSNCFNYLSNKTNPAVINFYNNYCHNTNPQLLQQSTVPDFLWCVTDAAGTPYTPIYLNNTHDQSEHPEMNFLFPGTYTVCLKVGNNGSFVYSCCLIITIPPQKCHTPPTCGVDYTYNSFTGMFTLDATNSLDVDNYKWDLPDAITLAPGFDDDDAIINFQVPNDCYKICLTTTNECGFGSYCIEVCGNCSNPPAPPTPTLITPVIDVNNQEVTFSGIPSSGYSFEWETETGTFINGSSTTSNNPTISFPDCGDYIVCLKLIATNNCADEICICWTISIPQPDPCNTGLCTGTIDYNCTGIVYDYIGNLANGDLTYNFSHFGVMTGDDIFCRYTIHEGSNANNPVYAEYNTENFNHTFSDPDIYTICFWWYDFFEGCLKRCCRTIYVGNPLSCGNASITYQYESGQNGFQFTMLDNYDNVSWTDGLNGPSLGTGITSNIVPIIGGCTIKTICVRYQDPNTGCWYICCFQYDLCPPQNCYASIDYEWDYNANQFQFTLNAGGQVVNSSIEWKNDNTGDLFGFDQLNPFYPFPLPCVEQTISVKYRDPITNCWYICCRTVYLCAPSECGTETVDYFYENGTIEVSLNANSVDENSITWHNDTDNTPISTGSDPTAVIPYPTLPSTNCEPKWISVRYRDPNTNCWYVCCRLIYFCAPDICGLSQISIADNGNDNYTLSIPNTYTGVQWYVNENAITGNNTANTNLAPNTPSVICVYYFNPSSGCWYVCCRTYSPTGCDLPEADFQYATNNLTVNFTNTSISTAGNATYIWLFGDGSTSIQTNPVHTYNNPGSYNCCLEVTDNCGESTLFCQEINVSTCNFPTANFSHTVSNLMVNFNNTSVSTEGNATYIWSFDDGNTSNEPSPTHTFSNAGTYNCCLTVMDGCGEDMKCQEIELEEINTDALMFIIDEDICGAPGTIVNIPVKVRNFNNITNFLFSLNIINSSVGILSGFSQVNSALGNIIPGSIADATASVFWEDGTAQGVTLNDDAVIFEVQVLLGATIGTASELIFSNSPANISAGGIVDGNFEDVEVVTDNGSFCIEQNILSTSGEIYRIKNMIEEPVHLVEVNLLENGQSVSSQNANGNYEFPNLEAGEMYEVVPEKDINPKNGVNGTDINLIRSKILGLSNFDTPYQHIAADVNKNGQVNGTDINIIRSMILGLSSSFPNNTSWRFVPANYTFQNPENPLNEDFPETLLYDPLQNSLENQDFIAVKVGDVNQNAAPIQMGNNLTNNDDALVVNSNMMGDLSVFASSEEDESGETVTIEFTVQDFSEVISFEFSVGWDASIIEMVGTPYDLHSSTNNAIIFNLTATNEGKIGLTWEDQSLAGQMIPNDEVLFKVDFNLIGEPGDCSIIEFTNDPTVMNVTIINFEEFDILGNSGNVKINEPLDPLTVEIEVASLNCFGDNNGLIEIHPAGGSGNYSINWNTNQTGTSINNLAAGNYSATITDNITNEQITTGNIEITSPPEIMLTTYSTPEEDGNGNGTATANANGGTPPYNYQWNDSQSQTTLTANQLSAGDYEVTVTDDNNCTKVAMVTVDFSTTQNISFTTSVNDLDCHDNENGSITLNITGGSGSYSISWNNGQTGISVTNLTTGNYSATITDNVANEVVNTGNIEITSPPELILSTTSLPEVNGNNNGVALVTVTGGIPNYAYQWNDPSAQTSSLATDLSSGTYFVTVTDQNSCTKVTSAIVGSETVPPPANDDCSDAIDLNDLFGQVLNVPQTSGVFTNDGADSNNDPSNGYDCFTDGELENTVWFTFEGDWDTYLIETIDCNPANSIFDPALAIYKGDNCSNLTPIDCNEDISAENSFSSITLETKSGTSYFVLVDGPFGIITGDFCIEVTRLEVNGTNNLPLGTEINIFPNPVTNQVLNIQMDGFKPNKEWKVDLINLQGQIIQTYEIESGNSLMDLQLNTSSGIYFLEFTSADYKYTEKVIVK